MIWLNIKHYLPKGYIRGNFAINLEVDVKILSGVILFFILTGCATTTFTRKAYVKRDRFGEGPVIDMRNMESYNQRKFEDRSEN